MDCFDPFKDYLELTFPRDMVESEESPVPQTSPERVAHNGRLNDHACRDWNNNDVSGQWTPGSSSGESSGARPLLGRRDSVDDGPLQSHNFPNSRKPVFSCDPSLQPASNATSKMWDYDSSTTLHGSNGYDSSSTTLHGSNGYDSSSTTLHGSNGYDSSSTSLHGSNGAWGNDCGAWTDMNSEINGQFVQHSKSVARASVQNTPSVWNGNSQTGDSSNGVYGSTGFFGSSETRLEKLCNETPVNSCVSQTQNEEVNVLPGYPRYSNGLNIEYPEAVSHVALLLNKLMQQSNANVATAENSGYRNFRSLDEGKFCAFCKRNRERREFYTTHVVKDSWGKVICPILRKYTCPICGATGDSAHTLRHCPARAQADLY